jgi:DNA-binding FadR family transcriptional regulator
LAASQPKTSANTKGLSQDRATERLRQFLLRGEFRPDERLSELSLVDRLGVSRTPIRRAFEKLAQEGLLVAKPNGGFVVRGLRLPTFGMLLNRAGLWKVLRRASRQNGWRAHLNSSLYASLRPG